MHIDRAVEDDVPALLVLQKLAFETEAAIYGDWSIPPLAQTEASLRDELARSVCLKAVDGGVIVGTVRGRRDGATCHLARLAVHPAWRRRGIGGALVRAIESLLESEGVERFELFTGGRSEDNLRLYRGLGYAEQRRERLSDAVTLVFMAKVARSRRRGSR